MNYLPCFLLVTLLGGALFWANRLAREDERRLAIRLAGAGWRVKYGGGILARAPFRLRWGSRLESWLVMIRPLAIRESLGFSAWFFECVLVHRVILVIRCQNTLHPSVVLHKGEKSLPLWRSWGPWAPYIVEREHKLCRLWFTNLWRDRERAAAFLSAIEEAMLDAKRVIAVEMSDDIFVIMSTRLSLPSDRFRFALEASRILEVAELPNVFAGVSLEPVECGVSDCPEDLDNRGDGKSNTEE